MYREPREADHIVAAVNVSIERNAEDEHTGVPSSDGPADNFDGNGQCFSRRTPDDDDH